MVGIYRWSGSIAMFAVVINILMMLAVMAMFGATLTLPGIAAVVLTVGMAVDGNILIYERIRDELQLGKSVRGAVEVGFTRAFSAILDGQLTTAAAGWVLLQYGSGPIKGFAVMLLVGIATTLFTNIWVTRIFFDWYVVQEEGRSWPRSRSEACDERTTMAAQAPQVPLPAASPATTSRSSRSSGPGSSSRSSLCAACIGMLFVNKAVRGDYMNWTIDFKGGTEIIFAFTGRARRQRSYVKADPAKVRARAREGGRRLEVSDISGSEVTDDDGQPIAGMHGPHAAVRRSRPRSRSRRIEALQRRSSPTATSTSASWSGDRLFVRVEAARSPTTEAAALFESVAGARAQAVDAPRRPSTTPTPTRAPASTTQVRDPRHRPPVRADVRGRCPRRRRRGRPELRRRRQGRRQAAQRRIKSIFYAMFLIMLYLAFRFDIRYAPGAAFATLHDAIMVIGVFAVTWTEVSLTSVAGLLTVIGFSVNDTVIVFDRIRENRRSSRTRRSSASSTSRSTRCWSARS